MQNTTLANNISHFLESLHKEQWQKVRLGEIAEVIGGGTPKTSMPEYWNGNIAWLTPKDLAYYNAIYISNGERFITEKGLKNSSATIMPKGTILLSSRAPIGYVAIAQNDICTNQGFKSLIMNPQKTNNLFMYYWIKNNVEYLKSLGTGTTFGEISKNIVQNITIPLPPLKVQEQIAEILSSFDDKIDLLNKQNKTLESLALTLFHHYFIDNPNRNEWEEKPLSEIAEIQNGYAFKNSDYVEQGVTTYEVLKMGHIESGGGLRYYPKAHYVKINDKMTKWVLNEDDIVLAMTDMKDSLGILGYPAMVDKSNYYVLNQRVARIYLKSKDDFLHNYFLFLYLSLQENIEKIQNLANGGVQVNLSTEAIKKFTITIPPLAFQNKNNQAFINIIEKYKNNRKQIQNLQAMRDLLMKAIFSCSDK